MMAKATRHSGESYTLEELDDPDLPIRIQRAVLGEVDNPSAGTHSSESSESELSARSSSNPLRQELVPTTENLSEGLQTTANDFTALSTDGNTQTTDQESSDEIEEGDDVPPYTEWSKPELKAECAERGLAVSGTSHDLVARLEEFDAGIDSNNEEENFE